MRIRTILEQCAPVIEPLLLDEAHLGFAEKVAGTASATEAGWGGQEAPCREFDEDLRVERISQSSLAADIADDAPT